jgi:hypothetical protein
MYRAGVAAADPLRDESDCHLVQQRPDVVCVKLINIHPRDHYEC